MTALPVIDGDASDSVWSQVLSYEGFTMAYPRFGGPSQSAATIKMGYTDKDIYIAAVCASAKVRSDGSIRDEKGTGDFLSVGFDTWNDDQYAFAFTVSASGHRTEERISSNQTEPVPLSIPDLNYHIRLNTLNISAIFSLYNG